MIVFRVFQTFPPNHNPIDGVGAFRKGGRWNSKGTYAVYTASSLALARAEIARHINLESIPDDFRVYEIEIPDQSFPEMKPLPTGWNVDPETINSQMAGNKFLQNPKILAFKVPSVCDHNSFNIILNPQCEQYSQVRVVNDYPFVP